MCFRLTTTSFLHIQARSLRASSDPHFAMSDNGEVEVAAPAVQILPKDVAAEIGTIKLFNKWSYEDVEVRDISLT